MKRRHSAAWHGTRSMRENVLGRPAREVETGAAWQELETGLREVGPAFALQHLVELCLQGMEMQDIRGGIAELLVAQFGGTPIGGLLLLRELDAEKVAAEILEAVAIGEGAREPRGDLGAIDRPCRDAEIMPEHGDVEAAEMEDLQDRGIGQQRLEAWRVIGAGGELHEMRYAITGRKLDQAQAVAMGIEAHRFRVDGDAGAEREAGGKVAMVEMDAHLRGSSGCGARPGEERGMNGAWCPGEDSNFHDLSATRT